jgi:hypothetical protein
VFRELHRIEKTLFLGFLVIVGAAVRFDHPASVAVVVFFYVVARLAMRYVVTGRAVAAMLPDLAGHGRKAGMVLAGQGVMAMAIALDCTLATRSSVLTYVLAPTLTVVAIAVFVNDLMGFMLARRALQASGEVRVGRRRGRS